MPQSKLTLSFILFTSLWIVWSAWDAVQPVLSSGQLAALFPLLPVSALLLGLSFFDNKDDDDHSGGTLQPIYAKARA